uniref:Cd(II)/Pb(II)-responsive transcriptional regulator n=1 Tax=Microbulbifer agarilyticus TaxID=260552 RepID=UPI000255B7CB|nr:Cd(II)/Pb(II)-responsive transcriptional regulator [Microbulbifer agarilyticus]
MRYRIGEVARLSDCKVETVRFYEQMGLLPVPARSSGNFRLYNESQLGQLRFIRHCRSLDIPLEDIRRLLVSQKHPEENCADINQLIDEQIDRVESRMQSLQQLRKQLVELRSQCSGKMPTSSCGILQGLSDCACHYPAER